jgi:uncharacterized membrane protein (UPF0136 family)
MEQPRKNNLTLPQMTLRFLWSILLRISGGIFLVAGGAKAFAFMGFVQSVGTLLHTGTVIPFIAAVVVTTVEVSAGAALLLTSRVRPATTALAILSGIFLWFLYPAVALNHPVVCNCFGILPFSLSNKMELLLDVALFNLFSLTAILWHRPTNPRPSSYGSMVFTGVIVIIVASMEAGLVHVVLSTPEGSSDSRFVFPALAFAESHAPLYAANAAQPRMLMLLDFPDFSCHLCFEDFLNLSDSLNALPILAREVRVVALLRQEGSQHLVGGNRLQRWSQETGLSYPVFFVPDSLLPRPTYHKSMVVIFNGQKQILFRADVPMGHEAIEQAMRLLR